MSRHAHTPRRAFRRALNRSNVGYGLTVFRSPRISRFPVTVIGTLPDGGTAAVDLILARASGNLVNAVGGIPYGSSGSPVYVGGNLIGAVSAEFYPDSKLIGITPKAAMLAVATEPGLTDRTAFVGGGATHPARLTAAGFASKRALDALRDRFGQSLPGQNSAGAQSAASSLRLRPGSPVGVGLLVGDINLGYIGTATIINADQLFAFGHPLLFTGPTNLPLTTAQIVDTARGDSPSKVGALGTIIGTVLEDRSAGIHARLGQTPDVVELTFAIRDDDLQQTTNLKAQAAPVPSELTFLIYIATVESMQRAMNRSGGGSATWEWKVYPSGAEQPIVAQGGTYDQYDIGGTVAAAVLPTIEELLQADQTIASVKLVATVTRQRLPEFAE